MSKITWKELVEIVGIFAVVASLLFVGVQLRQDQDIAEAQIYADFDDTQIALTELVLDNHDLWIAGADGEDLSDSDQSKFAAIANAVLAKYNGFISRARRLDTRPVEDYAVQYAYMLYSYPGLRNAFERRCRIATGLYGTDNPTCMLVLPVLADFDNGARAIPTDKYLAP
jgi:hypothetical protein